MPHATPLGALAFSIAALIVARILVEALFGRDGEA